MLLLRKTFSCFGEQLYYRGLLPNKYNFENFRQYFFLKFSSYLLPCYWKGIDAGQYQTGIIGKLIKRKMITPKNQHLGLCLELAICNLFLHSTLSKFILFVTLLIEMSFFVTSTNLIFGLSLPFFVSSNWINSLFSYLCLSCSPLNMTVPVLTSLSKFSHFEFFPIFLCISTYLS